MISKTGGTMLSSSPETNMQTKTRVAHIITRLIVGGAQENTVFTVNGLRRDPDFGAVDLIAGPELGAEGNLLDHCPCPGLITARHLRRNLSPLHDPLAVLELAEILRKGRYDIVHTHSSKAGIVGRLAARMAGTKIIVHTIHGLAFDEYQPRLKNAVYVRAERLCAKLSSAIITVSDEMARQALAAGVGFAGQYKTIYSGNDMAAYTKPFDRGAVLAKYKIPESRFLVGKVARFFPFKGYDYLLDVAQRSAPRHPDILFVLVGGGPLRESFEAEAQKRGLGRFFHFTGLVPPGAVPEIVSAMDTVVHLSLREGLARVIPQAMILGKPVIAFDLGAASEVIEQGRTGFVVRPGDIKDVSEKLEFFYNSRQLARDFGAAGQARARARFDKDVMVRQIADLYRSLACAARQNNNTPEQEHDI